MPFFISNLLLTILVELPVHLILLRRTPFAQVTLVCIFLNGFSLPLATYAFHEFGWNFYLVEALVILLEAAILVFVWKKRIPGMLLLSFIANVASAGTGLILAELDLL